MRTSKRHNETSSFYEKAPTKIFFSGQLLDGPRNEKRIIAGASPMQLSVYTVSLRAVEAWR
jgi:membrane protein DedA with SNARE-associated domain